MASLKRNQIHICNGVYLLLAMGLLLLPLQWVCAVILASLWHELCHYAAFRICGARPESWKIGSNGMEMAISDLTPRQEFFCALAGPLGGLLTIGVMRVFPRFSLCCIAHAIYNLLPVYPLDGGRALRCAGSLLIGVKGRKVTDTLSCICVLLLLVLGCYAAIIWKLGCIALLPGILLSFRSGLIKIPCKPVHKRVQ